VVSLFWPKAQFFAEGRPSAEGPVSLAFKRQAFFIRNEASQRFFFLISKMNLLFQLAVFSFIAFSFLLVIGVPVVSSSVGWTSTQNKTTLFTGIGLWFLLVFAVGLLNSFVV